MEWRNRQADEARWFTPALCLQVPCTERIMSSGYYDKSGACLAEAHRWMRSHMGGGFSWTRIRQTQALLILKLHRQKGQWCETQNLHVRVYRVAEGVFSA
jgi:hypothetical protein